MADTKIYNINNHIKKELYNEFKGSERKKTIILDNGKKYLLKLSDPVREKNRNLSYINNAYSEYLGCKIAKIIGLPVQNVILGEYTYKNKNGETHTRPACLCEDLRKDNEILLEMDTLSLSNYEDIPKELSFENINNKINHIKGLNNQELKDFYYDMFIFDALIGNTDRHNGNWGIITDKFSSHVRIAPIYDCGSSLLSLIGDNDFPLNNKDNLYLNICSAVSYNNKKINYKDYLANVRNQDVDTALLRLVPKINLEEINDIIVNTSDFSNQRKLMYSEFLNKRYNNIFIPALQNIFKIDEIKAEYENIDLFSFYKNNIEHVAKTDLYKKTNILFYDKVYELMRVNKKYALILNNDTCIGLLPIRSNNKEISKAITVLSNSNSLILKLISKDYPNIRDNDIEKEGLDYADD